MTGAYSGSVVNSGQEQAFDATFELAEDGRLRGRYVLHEPGRDVPGTLTTMVDEDCETTMFRWTDVYGSGVARLTFYPKQHCFDGHWGVTAPEPHLFWRACARSRVTS